MIDTQETAAALDDAAEAMAAFTAAWSEPAANPMPAPVRRAMDNINQSLATI